MSGGKAAAALLFFVALIAAGAAGVWLSCSNYRECRAHGFSRLYCASSEASK